MRKISKRLGAMLLIFTMLFQTFGAHVYAAPGTLSGNSIEASEESKDTYIDEVTGIELPDMRDEIQEYIDSDILSWIEENIPEDRAELKEKPQEWWDSLTPGKKRIVEIILSAVEAERTHYCSQPLSEILDILESGDAKVEDFFKDTVLEDITLENLYELKELGYEVTELEEAIYGIKGYEGYLMPDTDEMLMLAMSVSGFSPFMMLDLGDGGTGEATTSVTRVNTRNTGYTDGKGNQFWQITDLNGKLVYCLDHGKRCSRTFQYGNMTQISGSAAWLISNYGLFHRRVYVYSDGCVGAPGWRDQSICL